jgi:hypothetical protein
MPVCICSASCIIERALPCMWSPHPSVHAATCSLQVLCEFAAHCGPTVRRTVRHKTTLNRSCKSTCDLQAVLVDGSSHLLLAPPAASLLARQCLQSQGTQVWDSEVATRFLAVATDCNQIRVPFCQTTNSRACTGQSRRFSCCPYEMGWWRVLLFDLPATAGWPLAEEPPEGTIRRHAMTQRIERATTWQRTSYAVDCAHMVYSGPMALQRAVGAWL